MNQAIDITKKFVVDLHVAVEQMIQRRTKELVVGLIDRVGGGMKTRTVSVLEKPRKKMPRQLCPVPDCKKAAAPVYNMLCKDHKDTPERKVSQYRKARKLSKKLGVPIDALLKDWDKYRHKVN